MRSLFWNIFSAFLLAMVLIVVTVVLTSFQLARNYNAVDEVDRRTLMREVAAVVESDGVRGFDAWLQDEARLPADMTIYLMDAEGNDALGREVPAVLKRQWRRIRERFEHRGERRQGGRSPRMLRGEFEAPDGTRFRPVMGQMPPRLFGVLEVPRVALFILLVGILISAATCWALSRYLSRPLTRIAQATARLAEGELSARVGDGTYRGDELGALALQFDRMAAELERNELSRKDLLRNVSHELRSPLARIRVALELARRSPDEGGRHLTRIECETEEMDALIEQVLELTRVQHAASDKTQQFDLIERVEQLVDNARFEGKLDNKVIELLTPGGALMIESNATVLGSAIENVLRNAVAHAPADSSIEVVVRHDETNILIQISDQGSGVREQHLERLFEPFFRENDNTRPGAGVGLAITAQSLMALGGKVTARNREEGGLSVQIFLPAEVAGRKP